MNFQEDSHMNLFAVLANVYQEYIFDNYVAMRRCVNWLLRACSQVDIFTHLHTAFSRKSQTKAIYCEWQLVGMSGTLYGYKETPCKNKS